jgi:hypothetical protein
MTTDTLSLDTASVAQWQQMSDYDYSRDLIASDESLLEWLLALLDEGLRFVFGDVVNETTGTVVKVMCVVAVLALLVWIVYKLQPQLFRGSGKEASEYETEEDTIYGIDFEQRIDEAMMQQNYREAVRLNYLHTLKMLSDAGRIEWQLYKTPSQYTREYPTDAFRQLTNLFLLIRYGNREAGQEQADQAATLKQTVAAAFRQEGDEPRPVNCNTVAVTTDQEGGEP